MSRKLSKTKIKPQHSRSKKIGLLLFSLVPVLLILYFVLPSVFISEGSIPTDQTVAVKPVQTQILATGTIESQNEADLHFQTGGKLVSLPLKEGDTVKTGQVIGSLDTYALQQQLRQAYNTYQNSQDTLSQSMENQKSGVSEGEQRTTLDTTNKTSYSAVPEADVIYNTITRAIDQNKNNTDSAAISVYLAQYAIQLASITAPFDGVITHEDVKTAGVNVTPVTTFSIADPKQKLFRANVSESDISFVAVGSQATISLNGVKAPISGQVAKIYPQKITLASGENVYPVDITSADLASYGALKQTGSVLINNKFNQSVILAPAWTVLNGQTMWVERDNTEQLVHVTTGSLVGNDIEVTEGLTSSDRIIVNPKSLLSKTYHLL